MAIPPAPPPTSEGSGEAWVSRALGPALARVANHTSKSLESFPTNGWKRKEKKLFTHCSLPSVGASKQAPHLPRISTARQPGRPEHRGDANPVCAPPASGGNTGPLDLSLHCHCACVRAGYEHGTCSLLHMGRTRQTDRTGRIDSNCRARGRAGSAARARAGAGAAGAGAAAAAASTGHCNGLVHSGQFHWGRAARMLDAGGGRRVAEEGARGPSVLPIHPSIHPSVAVHHRVLAAAAAATTAQTDHHAWRAASLAIASASADDTTVKIMEPRSTERVQRTTSPRPRPRLCTQARCSSGNQSGKGAQAPDSSSHCLPAAAASRPTKTISPELPDATPLLWLFFFSLLSSRGPRMWKPSLPIPRFSFTSQTRTVEKRHRWQNDGAFSYPCTVAGCALLTGNGRQRSMRNPRQRNHRGACLLASMTAPRLKAPWHTAWVKHVDARQTHSPPSSIAISSIPCILSSSA
ncbi:hypothetical protein PCL_11088 [Purpureocillium lilacinum]|uniref:Uncharacterized protein n=1 Tax=Purpureocillium lilacinum TaxID=33203 RepID=A0A2U3ED72_PURLI|nr:hypothetical protein PCL_11088 [Purpureocillium lilacinum]